MKISLIPMEQPSEGVCVGTLDGLPLVFHGRIAVAGPHRYESKEIAEHILSAVEETARSVFGPEWVQPLSTVSGINIRTLQRDRIGRYGIPAHIMQTLGIAASTPCPRATGNLMLAVAQLARSNGHCDDPIAAATAALPKASEVATGLVRDLATTRAIHRAPALQAIG